jgi:hypothetical protein
MRGPTTSAAEGMAVVLDGRGEHWSARPDAIARLVRRGVRLWLLTRAAGGTARGLAVRELTEVRGLAPRTGGSGPVAGGAWGVAGGRIGLSEQGPGGAPVPGVGGTPGEPGVGGTPGRTEVGGTSTESGAGGPPAWFGPSRAPNRTVGGGGGTATTGQDLAATLARVSASGGIVVSSDRAVRAAAVVAGWDAVVSPIAACWRIDGHTVRFARLRGAAAVLDALPHLLVQERRRCPSGARDVLALTTDATLGEAAARGVATTALRLDPRTHDAVWIVLRGSESRIADALARRAVLLVDDDRGALVAVGPPVLLDHGDLAVRPPAWSDVDLTDDARDLAG